MPALSSTAACPGSRLDISNRQLFVELKEEALLKQRTGLSLITGVFADKALWKRGGALKGLMVWLKPQAGQAQGEGWRFQ